MPETFSSLNSVAENRRSCSASPDAPGGGRGSQGQLTAPGSPAGPASEAYECMDGPTPPPPLSPRDSGTQASPSCSAGLSPAGGDRGEGETAAGSPGAEPEGRAEDPYPDEPDDGKCQGALRKSGGRAGGEDDAEGGAERTEEEEKEEEYQYANKQPTLRGSVGVRGRRGAEASGYEEMGARGGGGRAKGGAEAGLGAFLKVRAGVGEPGGDRSFDNPEYWHTVCT